jgi:hypothetical protein
MILEFPRPPQATQQQQQEAGQPLLQLHSSYFYEGKAYIQAVCRFLDRFVAVLRSRIRIRRIRMCFGPPGPGSGSSSTRNGSGFFYNQAKIVQTP